MILVFGGTTEGRKAAEVLEEAGNTYYYSTKTGEQDITLQHGQRIDGALTQELMERFCDEHGIRLIIDAAHPFAVRLHQTIAAVAQEKGIPIIRYERIYPPRDQGITWIDDYQEIPRDIRSLLATTGVQSIAKLKPFEKDGMKIFYRILPRESSIQMAYAQGATDSQLCYYHKGSDPAVLQATHEGQTPCDNAEAILLKESGVSGGFPEKVEAARQRGMRIIALKRPELYESPTCNGPYGLRRMVERILPAFYPLHSGLTTGTCATAAAVAAAIRLLKGETPAEVPVILPDGETILVAVSYGDGYASVFKEAGDDPDVTNGLEIRASVSATDYTDLHRKEDSQRESHLCQSKNLCKSVQSVANNSVAIIGGEGVGRFTLPGFDYPPGEAAINKAPREMIRQNLEPFGTPLQVTISVPQGQEIARRTFNPRLGIEGGISIIGVSGIVKPFSETAFIDSIRKCMQVAKASGTERVVINSGGKSERFVKALYPALPQQAFVEYGNYIGETLKIADELGIRQVTLGVMLGKAVKLAAGHLDTHSRKATMDKDFIGQMLAETGITADISAITLARELWNLLSAEQARAFSQTVIRHCAAHCGPLLPNGSLTILLIDDEGHIYE